MHKPLVAIFAGSKLPADPVDLQSIIEYATKLGQDGFDIIYGGGQGGAMGLIAQSAQAAGSHVYAVVLEKYKHEPQLSDITMYNVLTESDRFSLLHGHENVVACVMFPGGPGSMRESLQVLELAVYEQSVPLVIPDIGLMSKHMFNLFQTSVEQGYIKESDSNKCIQWSKDTFLSEELNPELVSDTSPGL